VNIADLPEPVKRPLPLLPVAASDSLRHAQSVIDSLINSTIVSGTPGESPSSHQIKAAFKRIQYDIELAAAQAGIKL